MPDAVGYALPLDGEEGLADLVLVLERLLVDEGVELGLAVDALDVRENELNWLVHVRVGHVPDRLYIQPHVGIFHFLRLVHCEVVKEEMQRPVAVPTPQLFEEGDEGVLLHCFVEDHDAVHSSVG